MECEVHGRRESYMFAQVCHLIWDECLCRYRGRVYLWNVRGRVAIVDCLAYVLAGFVYFTVYWVCVLRK